MSSSRASVRLSNMNLYDILGIVTSTVRSLSPIAFSPYMYYLVIFWACTLI